MTRLEAIQTILEALKGDELIVHANGAMSRESYQCQDRKRNFYMLGSMGLASSIGLGLALARPKERVLVIDGDGNVLMGFGNLALIGALQPTNLFHLVIDNQAYGTTGNQPTISAQISISTVARTCGYRTAAIVTNKEGLVSLLTQLYAREGPHFLQIWVTTEEPLTVPRIPLTAEKMKERFMKGIAAHGGRE